MKFFTLAPVTSLLTLLLVLTPNLAGAQTAPNKRQLPAVLTAVPHTTTAAEGPTLSLEEVEAIALHEVPGGEVTSVEREHKKGRAVFEVDVTDVDGWEIELTLDAHSGEVLRRKRGD